MLFVLPKNKKINKTERERERARKRDGERERENFLLCQKGSHRQHMRRKVKLLCARGAVGGGRGTDSCCFAVACGLV